MGSIVRVLSPAFFISYVLTYVVGASFFYFFTESDVALVLWPVLVLLVADIHYWHRSKRLAPPTTKTVHHPLSPDMKHELEMARRVQQGLLSLPLPEIEGIRIGKQCLQAASVGGDFFSVTYSETPSLSASEDTPGVVRYQKSHVGQMGIIIGDVAGHGVSSALVMALASGMLSEIGATTMSPAKTMAKVNSGLHQYIENSRIPYVTAFYGVLDVDTRQFTFTQAGHPPAIRISAQGEVELLESEGGFLGMFEDETFEEKRLSLKSGDRLILYTDGMTEAKNGRSELYGQDRFVDVMTTCKGMPPDDAIESVLKEIRDYAVGHVPADDQSILIIDIA